MFSVHHPFDDEDPGMVQFRYKMRGQGKGKQGLIPILQYRHCVAIDASGAFCPGEWSRWTDIKIAKA